MNNNVFKKWHPIPDADNVYDIDMIGFGIKGLVLSLIPDDIDHNNRSSHKLTLTWEDPLSYHVAKETIREDLWISDPSEAWTFFTSCTSPYIDHFIKGSVLFPENSIHFLIRGTNFIVDIISLSYPDVTISSL